MSRDAATDPDHVGANRAGPGRILLVEDDEAIGRAVADGLRAHGYAVSWRDNGMSALAEAERMRFDVVVLDLGLPDIDGVELCRDLRFRQPAGVIVMLTARSDEMDVVVGIEAGADDYITKPFVLADLLARVTSHLRPDSDVIPLSRARARRSADDDKTFGPEPYNWE